MFRLASLVRPILALTVILVDCGSSRTIIDPLSKVRLPGHMVSPTKLPVMTREEFVMRIAPPLAMVRGDAVAIRVKGRFVPTSVICSELVAPVWPRRVRVFKARLVAAVAESMVTVLLPALVIRIRPPAWSGGPPSDQLLPILHRPLAELVHRLEALTEETAVARTRARTQTGRKPCLEIRYNMVGRIHKGTK